MKHLIIGGIAALAIGLTGCSSTTSASGPSSTKHDRYVDSCNDLSSKGLVDNSSGWDL